MANTQYNFVIDWTSSSNSYRVWTVNFNLSTPKASPLEDPKEYDNWPPDDQDHHLVPVGNYLLDWVPATRSYALLQFDPGSDPPLSPALDQQGNPIKGTWPPPGDSGDEHELISIANYLLDWVPATGDFELWQFDPQGTEPLNPLAGLRPTEPGGPPQNAPPPPPWQTIREGHQLLPLGNFVIDLDTTNGTYRLWQFDPQSTDPLPGISAGGGPVYSGSWPEYDTSFQLVPIGDKVISWVPAQKTFKVWDFESHPGVGLDPLGGPSQSGTWEIGTGHNLVGVQPVTPQPAAEAVPGTIEFMRQKIKHVVYYMVENRSFDSVCGWLYDSGVNLPNVKFIGGGEQMFQGASTSYANPNSDGTPVPLSQYNGGKLSKDIDLNIPTAGANHDHIPVMAQLFLGMDGITYQGWSSSEQQKLYEEILNGPYGRKQTPEMLGFVEVQGGSDSGNSPDQIMSTYSKEQLPVLNGLAGSYAVSDEWYCSIPGPTDVNRAFSLTGSSFGRVENFEGATWYPQWPTWRHRPSLWYTLWANGFKDWKIYYQDNWRNFCYTDHLFLKGLIPTVDQDESSYVATFEQFIADTEPGGTLPRLSFLEPAWVGGTPLPPLSSNAPPNSYHSPSDLVPGEQMLNFVYERLVNSGSWDETLLVITFDEHGGIYDHTPPPYGARPYLNDDNGGFEFDLFGVRVPTILASPFVTPGTVFRSETEVPYDATSFLATLLSWYGIPKERWGLGERTANAPTFEGILTEDTPQGPPPTFKAPYDEKYPLVDIEVNDLHETFVPRIVSHLAQGKLDGDQIKEASDEILSKSKNIEELHAHLRAFQEKHAS